MTQSERKGMAGLIFMIRLYDNINFENKTVSAISTEKKRKTSTHAHTHL
jgi:hypothetical protein